MAYVSYPEGTLWRSKLDGSERLQLTSPPMYAMLPRWSPDGQKIVFFEYGRSAGKPARMYQVPAGGGSVRQILGERGMVVGLIVLHRSLPFPRQEGVSGPLPLVAARWTVAALDGPATQLLSLSLAPLVFVRCRANGSKGRHLHTEAGEVQLEEPFRPLAPAC